MPSLNIEQFKKQVPQHVFKRHIWAAKIVAVNRNYTIDVKVGDEVKNMLVGKDYMEGQRPEAGGYYAITSEPRELFLTQREIDLFTDMPSEPPKPRDVNQLST